ncbi:unnamed protein product [Kuraishia capsulata CBS 1993]|uniref:Endoplasmic reticulum junction formation protein lunapark n=1 Tax=Kuraishia capsulata CBS 1993 TaxID=1382522 RepID=W6MRH4_9ASCO|nr:uncharacterized protein KUCA_T00004949001 [Kuraishia capsulata CBS 1993]CDK28963.1 unnamed protein product [Kuraishia capsulata CBS 1993]
MGWVPFRQGGKKFDADKFEKELKGLSGKITANDKKLIKLRRDRETYMRAVILYPLSVYFAFLAYIFYLRSDWTDLSWYEWLAVVLLPVGFGHLRKLIGMWYDRTSRIVTGNLEKLREEHEEKIQELKEQSRFDRTAELLKRFGTGEDIAEMEREKEEILKTREEYFRLLEQGESQKSAIAKIGGQSGGSNSVYDAFVNMMIGPDETSAEQRYALICQKCHRHNGLAPPGTFPHLVSYECPGCGTMNGAVSSPKSDLVSTPSEISEEDREREDEI